MHMRGAKRRSVHPKGVGISNAGRVQSALESAASRTDPASSDPRVERARDNIAAEGRVCERARLRARAVIHEYTSTQRLRGISTK